MVLERRIDDIEKMVGADISDFHAQRLSKISNLQLEDILFNKNPYFSPDLYRNDAHGLVKKIIDEFLSSQENKVFSQLLMKITRSIYRSAMKDMDLFKYDIDLALIKNGVIYLIVIIEQLDKLEEYSKNKTVNIFRNAKKYCQRNQPGYQVDCLVGCWYANSNRTGFCGHKFLSGLAFWEFLFDDKDYYSKIIEHIIKRIHESTDDFYYEYCRKINIITCQFINIFCQNGYIDWKKIIDYESVTKNPVFA